MTRNEYFEHPALSRGTLLNFKKSARTGSFLINKEFDSSSMLYGRAVHSVMSNDFEEEFYIFDDSGIIEEIGGKKPRGTSAYKAWKGNLILENEGKEAISYDDYMEILNLTENVKKSDFYAKAITHSGAKVETEKAFIATIGGKEFKCLADVAVEYEDRIVVIDWKSTRMDLDPSKSIKIMYELQKWDLTFQQHHYTKVIEAATGKPVVFVFVFMENHTGFEFLPIMVSKESDLLTQAAIDYDSALLNYDKYLAGDLEGIQIEDNILIIE